MEQEFEHPFLFRCQFRSYADESHSNEILWMERLSWTYLFFFQKNYNMGRPRYYQYYLSLSSRYFATKISDLLGLYSFDILQTSFTFMTVSTIIDQIIALIKVYANLQRKNGIIALHGSRKAFTLDTHPVFKAVYQTWVKVRNFKV